MVRRLILASLLLVTWVAIPMEDGTTDLHAQSSAPAATPGHFPAGPHAAVAGLPAILSLRDQAAVYNAWLRTRLDRILPELMRQEGIDMWLVICRENNEDPVFSSLVPFTSLYASRTSILVFFDKGLQGVERLTVSRSGIGGLYTSVWVPEKIEQWARLAEIIKERNPKAIGINESEAFNYGDGLTGTLKKKLVAALPPEFQGRLKPADRLAIRWLERRSTDEMEVYPQIVAIAHGIIADAFSNRVITPGVTTTDDVVWYFRERSRQLGLTNWFHPSVDIQRPKDSPHKDSPVIHRGDLLHCDFGITYLKLCTDTQQMAYVLKDGETEAPAGLRAAFALGNRLQDILLAEMKTGLTGNQILAAALTRAKTDGLTPSIYTHPIGVHGHAAGVNFGMWDQQGGVPGTGDLPLFEDTAFSIELNVRANVPEWANPEVRIPLEQDILYRKTGPSWLDKRQTSLILIR
jgi:Xaa-Pro aminopeptidase